MTIVSDVGARADSPEEARKFFSNLIENFAGNREELLNHIRKNLRLWFRCVDKEPDWIQGEDWQFSEGKPMIFAGHIDISKATGVFHEDARLFVFISDLGETKIVTQVW